GGAAEYAEGRGVARSLVESARPDDDDDDTYQARLLRAGISKDEVKVQIEDVIFAGTDSTGMNLSTLCWNLAKHPAIYQTLRHEVLTADAADRTYVLPPSTTVGLQPHTLHSNPDVFRHPHEFDPARWLREGEPSGPEMRRDFVPFGVGSRMCIARNLAMMELGVAARALARSGVLEGASVVGGGAEGRVEILEWFNSRVKGGKMELVWR
ncbi:benzoate 4-monooxygenase Cytochrome-P450, partial [Teratosphaeria destructans]